MEFRALGGSADVDPETTVCRLDLELGRQTVALDGRFRHVDLAVLDVDLPGAGSHVDRLASVHVTDIDVKIPAREPPRVRLLPRSTIGTDLDVIDLYHVAAER